MISTIFAIYLGSQTIKKLEEEKDIGTTSITIGSFNLFMLVFLLISIISQVHQPVIFFWTLFAMFELVSLCLVLYLLVKGVTDTTETITIGIFCTLITLVLVIKGSIKVRDFEMYEMSSSKYQYYRRG